MFAKRKQAAAFLLVLLTMLSLYPQAVFAEEEPAYPTIELTGRYISPANSVSLQSWQFPYSDAYFLQDASIYQHDLARASLGMALSAFRNTKTSLGRQQENILSYMKQAGFSSIRQDGYDRITSADTISTMIGHKQIGDFTLIATAVCGGGYGNEWKSNFLVGEEIRSVGFHNASRMVQERIRSYIESNELTGDIRLWIAGYSRAAAVSNLTAADMTDSGLFSQVYAYTFATPNVTREKKKYDNIFNIIGKTDPVPCVPLRDWGYAHYGIDLYTPAQEYDSDYNEKIARAGEISQKLIGKPFRNNPVMNYTLRNVLGYLLTTYPSPGIYQDSLGETLIAMWGADGDTIITNVEKALRSEESMPPEQRTEFRNLSNYVEDQISYQIRTRERMVQYAMWDPTVSLSDNVVHEHNPDVYVDWMFSSDKPEEIFSNDADSYYRVVIYGRVTVDIYDPYGFVQRLLPNGQYELDGRKLGEEPRIEQISPIPFCTYENDRWVIVLPKDRMYALSISTQDRQEIRYLAATFRLDTLKSNVGDMHTVTLEPGEEYYIIASDEFFSLSEENSDTITQISTIGKYSPSLMIQAESMNVFNLTLMELLAVISLTLILIGLFLLVELILFIVRHIRRKRRKYWVTIVTHGLVTLFFYFLAEWSRYYLNAITMAYILLKSTASFSIAMMSLKAAVVEKKRLGWFIFAAMIFALCGDISPSPTLSLAFFAVFMLLMLIGMFLEKRHTWRRFLVALVLWIACLAVIFVDRYAAGSLTIYFILYSALLVLLPVMSWKIQPLLFIGCILFAVSNVILGVNMIFNYGYLLRAIGVGYYLLGTFMISLSAFFLERKRKKRKKEASPAGTEAVSAE